MRSLQSRDHRGEERGEVFAGVLGVKAIQEAKDIGKGKEKEVVLGLSNIIQDDETIEVDLDQSLQRKTMILSLNMTLLTTTTKTLIMILIEIKMWQTRI
jgi:hypothetical protein